MGIVNERLPQLALSLVQEDIPKEESLYITLAKNQLLRMAHECWQNAPDHLREQAWITYTKIRDDRETNQLEKFSLGLN